VPVNDEIAARRVVISSLTLKYEVNDEIAARRGRHFVVDVRNDERAHAEARFRRRARRPPAGGSAPPNCSGVTGRVLPSMRR
jgi:hypothetical protein